MRSEADLIRLDLGRFEPEGVVALQMARANLYGRLSQPKSVQSTKARHKKSKYFPCSVPGQTSSVEAVVPSASPRRDPGSLQILQALLHSIGFSHALGKSCARGQV